MIAFVFVVVSVFVIGAFFGWQWRDEARHREEAKLEAAYRWAVERGLLPPPE